MTWYSALSYSKSIGQVILVDCRGGGGGGVVNFDPALPLPISCETALALVSRVVWTTPFRKNSALFNENYPF